MKKQATDRHPIRQEASHSEQRILERIQCGGFAVALSGGGHRATLAAIGALLALVDRRLNRQVMQIASISGGSITNAYFAQRCDFDALEPGGLDPLAAELATTVVERGALTGGWILAIFFGAALVWGTASALLIWAGFGTLGGLAIAAAVWLGLVVGLGALLWGGHIIEWLLDRRYFRPPSGGGLKPHSRALVNSLAGRRVDHVFGMTDLVLGQPVYVSCQQGGMAYRRLGASSNPVFDTPPFQTFDVGEWSIAGVVRASAAFPGIPPRRVRVPRDPGNPDVAGTPSIAFLGDGGIWNNLGTQVLRESKFLGVHSAREDGIPRPFGPAPDMPLLIVNGSAPLKPARTLPFYVPGIAQLLALFQTTQVLNANTVEPRVNEFVRSFLRRVWRSRRPDSMDPLDLVVDLRGSLELARSYAHPYEESLIRLTDGAVREWERGVLVRVRNAIESREGSPGLYPQ